MALLPNLDPFSEPIEELEQCDTAVLPEKAVAVNESGPVSEVVVEDTKIIAVEEPSTADLETTPAVVETPIPTDVAETVTTTVVDPPVTEETTKVEVLPSEVPPAVVEDATTLPPVPVKEETLTPVPPVVDEVPTQNESTVVEPAINQSDIPEPIKDIPVDEVKVVEDATLGKPQVTRRIFLQTNLNFRGSYRPGGFCAHCTCHRYDNEWNH